MEGFRYTGNVKRYLIRLCLFAFLSEIPFNLANGRRFIYPEQQNVFFGLFLGLAGLTLYKRIDLISQKQTRVFSVMGIIVVAVMILYLLSGAKWAGVPILNSNVFITLMLFLFTLLISMVSYLIYRKKKSPVMANRRFAKLFFMIGMMFLAVLINSDYSFGIVVCTTLLYKFRKSRIKASTTGILTLILTDPSEITAVMSIPLICLYNRERGLKMKYFFYAFYPIHLLLIAAVCYFFIR